MLHNPGKFNSIEFNLRNIYLVPRHHIRHPSQLPKAKNSLCLHGDYYGLDVLVVVFVVVIVF